MQCWQFCLLRYGKCLLVSVIQGLLFGWKCDAKKVRWEFVLPIQRKCEPSVGCCRKRENVMCFKRAFLSPRFSFFFLWDVLLSFCSHAVYTECSLQCVPFGCCPEGMLQLGNCEMHHFWLCLFCGWIIGRSFSDIIVPNDSFRCWSNWVFSDL